jgi:phospho-N-acetylmuramoyl-pentapeptide-transferase
MINLLVKSHLDWLEKHNLGFLRVFTFVTFQATVAVMLSFLIVILAGPGVIAWLRKQKIGDLAKFDQADIDKVMAGKKGTPTMGGVLINVSILFTAGMLADLKNFYVLMAMLCVIWLGTVGAVDDWLKLTAARRGGGRQGLSSLEKLIFQIALGLLLSIFTYSHGRLLPEATGFHVPFWKNPVFQLSAPLYILIGTFIITGTSNAVNLTDGLDGLSSGCVAIVGIAFLVLSLIIGDLKLASALLYHHLGAAGQMAVLAGAVVGACLGFLWFNCNPASVFMGDTGSLALGGLIGYIAIVIRQELMLGIVGGIFVVEALSVLMQVSYFKYTKRKHGEGRRILLMAPLHHHFQKLGWTETQVVVRFWLIGAMLAALGIASVKLR